jgi:CubicO group peptidase (beta-lactamase class C family)
MKQKIYCLFLFFLIPLLPAKNLPTAKPEEVGLSPERLTRIKPVMQGYIDQDKLPGLITLVARRGKVVHFEKYGNMDKNKPMQYDTIFRIASMTKPVTGVAVMMLYEEGHFLLDDPVSKFIPGFKDVKVFSGVEKGEMKCVEPGSPITIRDLLTHTAGLTYGAFGDTPVDLLYRKAGLYRGTLKDMVQKLTKIPLLYQPGSRWHYSVATDVLGYLVEVISGQPFDRFLEQRLFKPLGMKDTGFYVPGENISRFAALYGLRKDGSIKIIDSPAASRYARPPEFVSGGGGLVSTVSDYFRFAHMLLNKGEYEGKRFLGRKTVEFMTRNHLPEEFLPIHPVLPGKGFGLGFAVLVDVPGSKTIGSAGEFEWRGINNTFFWVDPEEELIMILMTQFSPYLYYPVNKQFKVLTYQAIVD